MPELDEALDEALAPRDLSAARLAEERDEKWRIDGERTVDWALRRLARVRVEMERDRAQAGELIAATNEWLAKELERLERDERFFVGKLREWSAELEANGDTRKTVNYPAGKLKRSTSRTRLEIADEAALLAWLEENVDHPERVVDYKATIRKDELKRRYKTKGDDRVPGDYPLVDAQSMEILPGVRVVRPEPGFDVETTPSAPAPATDHESSSGAA